MLKVKSLLVGILFVHAPVVGQIDYVLAEARATKDSNSIKHNCSTLLPQGTLAKGDSYATVIKQLGSPIHKIEHETKRKDIWIYKKLAIEFVQGKIDRMLCSEDNQEKKELQSLKVSASQKKEVLPVENQPTNSEVLKSFNEAISILNDNNVEGAAGEPNVDKRISPTRTQQGGFPVGESLPAEILQNQQFDIVE